MLSPAEINIVNFGNRFFHEIDALLLKISEEKTRHENKNDTARAKMLFETLGWPAPKFDVIMH